jgi:hypothetical protein
MRGVRLHALNSNTCPPGTAGAQYRSIVCAEDEGVAVGVSQVLGDSGGLVDVLTKRTLSLSR